MSDWQSAPQQHATLSTRLQDQDQYLLHDQREVRRVLRALIDKRSLVTVHLSSPNRMFPSALVSLSEDEQSLSVDGSRDPRINEAMAQANHVTCVTTLDRIPIQFRLAGLRPVRADGRSAFEAPLPPALLYLQRREFHRLQVPVVEPVVCRLTGQPEPAPGPRCQQLTELRLLDISVGGCSVALPHACAQFHVGDQIDCSLHLPDAAAIPLRLLVRSRFEPPAHDKTKGSRAGCAFLDLPAGAESQIQRYIFKIDRHRKARERGEA